MECSLISILNGNQGVLSFLAIIVAVVNVLVMIRLSKIVTDTTGQLINKQNISTYMHKKIPFLMELEKDDEKIEIQTLHEFVYYSAQGYEPVKQYQINGYTYLDAIINLIQLIKSSRNDTYKPTNTKFLDIIKQLPVGFMLSEQDIDYTKNKETSLCKYMKNHNIKITKLVDGLKIEHCDDNSEVHKYYIIKQLYRADFSGKNREEILFLCFSMGKGSMQLTNLLGAYFGRKHWYSLRKKWHMLDLSGIETDVYYEPFV